MISSDKVNSVNKKENEFSLSLEKLYINYFLKINTVYKKEKI